MEGQHPTPCSDREHPLSRTALLDPRSKTYRSLVMERKACRLCPRLTNVSCAEGGALDSDEIGPYTRWHADLEARLVVVGKDFAPAPRLAENGGRPGARVQTNLRLIRYLAEAGFDAGSPRETYRDRGLFFTNSVLCLPEGMSMRTAVRQGEVDACARRFLWPTLELLRPRAIATLGSHAMRAVLVAAGLTVQPTFQELVEAESGLELPGGTTLFAMPHPMGTKWTRPQNEAAWRRVGQ